MGLWESVRVFAEQYERGKAFGEVTGLLSKNRRAVAAQVRQWVSSRPDPELDQIEGALLHVSENALTSSSRQYAADIYEFFCQMRG